MDICRCCLNKLEDSLLESNQNNLSISLELCDKLMSCCSFSVHFDDDYPKHLCNSCLEKVNSFYEFQQMYKVSQERLESMTKANDSLLEVIEEQIPDYDLDQGHIESDITIEPYPFDIGEKEKIVRKRGRPRKLKNNKVESGDEIQNSITVYQKEISITQDSENDNLEGTESNKEKKNTYPEHIIVPEYLALYPCSQANCNRNFPSYNALKEHQKDHGFPSIHRCEYEGCNKVFRQQTRLDMHLHNCHVKGSALKKHICEVCGKVFKSIAVLNSHQFTHKDKSELPFLCFQDGCQRRFANKGKLKVHMMRHAGIKNFSCPYCGMKKTTKNELNVHINYHTLERTWSCKYCPKVCNSAGNLKMHVRAVHERAKDYACRFCEKTFAKSDTRKYHEMTHTGEKPHVCDVCGKRFTQPAALRTHKKIHFKGTTPLHYSTLLSAEEREQILNPKGDLNYIENSTACVNSSLWEEHIEQI